MYGETLYIQCQDISNGKIKYPIGKSIVAVNLPLKLTPATITNANIGSIKSLHTLFDKHLDNILVKFEQNRMARTTRNFEIFYYKTFLSFFLFFFF